MTIRGTICVILEVLLLVLALGTGLRELLVVAFCLGVILLLALASLLLALLTLHPGASVDKTEALRGDDLLYTLTVRGFALLPVMGYLSILPPGTDRWERADVRSRHAFLLLPSFRIHQFPVKLNCVHAGFWPMQPEYLRYEDMFGLFRFSMPKNKMRRQLTVFPRIHDLGAEAGQISMANGFSVTQIRSSESGEMLGDTRQYRPGDSLKRIHWKLSARTQEMYTRQYEMQENAQVLILLDLVCRSHRVPATADIALETTLSLLDYYAQQNKPVRLLPVRGNGHEEYRVQNQQEVLDLRPRLMEAPFACTDHPLELWQLADAGFTGAGTIFVVTDNPSRSLLDSLDSLQAEERLVGCFAPCVDVPELEPTGSLVQPVTLFTPDEITEKVGACL